MVTPAKIAHLPFGSIFVSLPNCHAG